MKGMSNETCLIPTPEGESRLVATSYSFITECFFLTHRALDLGYCVILERLVRYDFYFINDCNVVPLKLKN